MVPPKNITLHTKIHSHSIDPIMHHHHHPQDFTEKQMQLLQGLRRLEISNCDLGQDPAPAAAVAAVAALGELPLILDIICCMKWPLSDGDLMPAPLNPDLLNEPG